MRVKILLIFAIGLLPFAIFSQISEEMNRINSDSLMKALPELEGTEKIDTLNRIAFRIAKDFPDSCRKLASWTVRMSDSLNYQKGLADGYQNLGDSYYVIDSLYPAMINFLNALRIYEQLGPSLEYANVCKRLAELNFYAGRKIPANDYDMKAIDIYTQLNEEKYLAQQYRMISSSLCDIGAYDSSLIYNDLAMAHADSSVLYLCYHSYGQIYHSQFSESGDTSLFNKAIKWYLKGLNYPGIDIHFKAAFHANLYNLYSRYGEEKKDSIALSYLSKVIPIAKGSQDAFYLIPSAYRHLGNFKSYQKDYDSALIYYKKTIEVIDEELTDFSVKEYSNLMHAFQNRNFMNIYKRITHYYLYTTYQYLGEHKKASEQLVQYNKSLNEAQKRQNEYLITMLEAESQNEKSLNQIVLLEKENEVKDLSIRQSRTYLLILLGFILILLLVTLLFIRQRRIRTALKEQKLVHDLTLKKVESDKLKELDKMKSNFFANISHEFRTPLTLILGPLDKLRSYIKDEEREKDLDMIQRNARRLQNLINQLLSLSKLESGKMKLKVREEDIVALSKGYAQSFESLAKQKNIKLEFESKKESILAYIDKDKYEKILFNLISNAFKFTQKRGRIAVQIDSIHLTVDGKKTSDPQPSAANHIIVTIADTGRGISPKKLPHIFNRFYQADDLSNNYQEGTGIGLALSKELVELHHGTIKVESETEKGTAFTLTLPIGKDHFQPEDFISDDELEKKDGDSLITIEEESYPATFVEPEDNNDEAGEAALTEGDTKPILLIVEDNADMRHYIHSNISGDFRLIEAEDGEQGLEKAIEKVPDLIISDVMMPKMDGMELCRKLKSDERTSHIPIILLTAKAALEDRLEGLETGADDFLTKPFDQQELLVRVNNLLRQRRKLQERFTRNAKEMGLSEILNLPLSELNSTDQKFLMKVIEIVKTNLHNENFNTEVLQHELLMSNAQLYRKLKSLVGMPASGFIRSIRLNRAAELLKLNKGNITEIAFEVGFNNLSYFSKCFQEQFGVLPSEFNS